MDHSELRRAVIATVVYYDVLEYPMTSFEVWKHLLHPDGPREGQAPVLFQEVLDCLRGETEMGRLEQASGFFFLQGRGGLVPRRIAAEKCSARKLRRIMRLARILRCVPFVRMIAVSGSLSLKLGDEGSDWDFFTVLRSGRIWTGRTLLTATLQLLGKRRHGSHVKDRACLNYYVTDESLRIEARDLYASHEYRFLYPLFNFSLFQRFERANAWIRDFRPNWSLTEAPTRFTLPESALAQKIQAWGEWIVERLVSEAWLASWQTHRILRNPLTKEDGSYIEADARMLIFLPKPRGPRVFSEYKKRLADNVLP